MGLCGTKSVDLDPSTVDIRHFDVQRVIGQGGFGKVNAVIKITGKDSNSW